MIASLYQRGSSVSPKTSGGILASHHTSPRPTGEPEIPDPALHSTLGAGGIRTSSTSPAGHPNRTGMMVLRYSAGISRVRKPPSRT